MTGEGPQAHPQALSVFLVGWLGLLIPGLGAIVLFHAYRILAQVRSAPERWRMSGPLRGAFVLGWLGTVASVGLLIGLAVHELG